MVHEDIEANGGSDYDWVGSSSDADLAQHISKLRSLPEHDSRVINISDNYISKAYIDTDLDGVQPAVDYAISIGVRAPTIRRVVQSVNNPTTMECIQTRIHGHTLMESWPSVGLISTVRLGLQLRGMVRKMRTSTSPTAGTLGTGFCRSFWIEDRHGLPLSPTARVVTCVVNFWYNYTSFKQESRKTVEEHVACVAKPLAIAPLVFTHHDLAPRNLMVDSSNKLWIIDWDDAGWYPTYFEYAGMHNFYAPPSWSWLDRYRWNIFVWLATGSYEKERRILFEAQRKAIRFPVARRFNIKAGATPSLKSPDE